MAMQSRRQRQAGLSLVELMVGITIGLIVVAATSLMFSGQLAESRRLIAEAQVQQDIRVSVDIIARELRRSGALGRDDDLQDRIWSLDSATDPFPNRPSSVLNDQTGSALVGTNDEVIFDYFPAGQSTRILGSAFGFRLAPERGTIQTRHVAGGAGGGHWQDLTDPATMRVTEFAVTRVADSVSVIPCTKPCPSGDTSCWPSVNQRTLVIRVTAVHPAFPQVQRTHEARVRLRNDHFRFFNVASLTSGQVCPP
jgi:type II secretory pathway component PulJ